MKTTKGIWGCIKGAYLSDKYVESTITGIRQRKHYVAERSKKVFKLD